MLESMPLISSWLSISSIRQRIKECFKFISDGLVVVQFIDDGFLLFAGEFTELRLEPQMLRIGSPKEFKQGLNTGVG